MNKYLLSFFLLASLGATSIAHARPDTTPPTVDMSSLQLSKTIIKAGEETEFSLIAHDENSGLNGSNPELEIYSQNGYLEIQGPPGALRYDPGWGRYDSKSGRIIIRINPGKYAVPGVYKITKLKYVRDYAGNEIEPIDVSNLNFTFTVLTCDSSIDVTPPTVDTKSFHLSKTAIMAGEETEFSFLAYDENSGLNGSNPEETFSQNGHIEIQGPPGARSYSPNYGVYDQKSGRIVIRINPGKYAVPGIYKITKLRWVRDYAGNEIEPIDLTSFDLSFTLENP